MNSTTKQQGKLPIQGEEPHVFGNYGWEVTSLTAN